MKIKIPEEFGPDDLETIFVYPAKGIFNGSLTLGVAVSATAGPIHQSGLQMQRFVHILPNQKSNAFEQWLYAIWRPEINAWTVDHPGC